MYRTYRFSWWWATLVLAGIVGRWAVGKILDFGYLRLSKLITERLHNLPIEKKKLYFGASGAVISIFVMFLGGYCFSMAYLPSSISLLDQGLLRLMFLMPFEIVAFLYLGVPGYFWFNVSERIFGKAEPQSVWDMERYALEQKRNYTKVPRLPSKR